MVGLNSILREALNTSANTEDKREKIQALSLAKECYSMKLDLLTNATVVDDAIRFASEKPKDHDTVIVNKENNKEEFHKFHGLEGNNNVSNQSTTNRVF
jgi:hypothetical protein